jgi:Cytochrome c
MRAFPASALCLLAIGMGCQVPETDYPDVQGVANGGPGALVLGPQASRLPISGGTLLVTSDGATAVAADPDLDLIGVVDVASAAQIATIRLQPGDEPGRLAEDAAGRVHVALRRGGAVVTFEPRRGAILYRRPACAAPRGLAYDAASDVVHVACAGGELVTFPAAAGDATRRVLLDRDLRDVVIDGGQLTVSTFRTAEVLTLDAEGAVASRRYAPSLSTDGDTFAPDVAWRMIGLPGGGVVVAHERAQTTQVVIDGSTPDPYASGTPCGEGIVHGAVSVFLPGESPSWASPILTGGALPVDITIAPDGSQIAVVAAGTSSVLTLPLADATDGTPCAPLDTTTFPGGAVAAAFDGAGNLVVQTRGPSVWVGGTEVKLFGAAGTPSSATVGFDLFHQPPNGGSLACASCHPEGREDGRIWLFDTVGPRRTQALAGDVTTTAPFHWGGELADLGDVMGAVFVVRMGGSQDNLVYKTAGLTDWLSTIPAPPASQPADAASVERGSQLFADESVGCATCHSGPKHTDNQTVDVGTGQPLQVPWLVGVAWRAPFMHDGCAATLTDRFDPVCGGSKHGNTASLSADQIADLVAFLETL